jgi:hypothetical protein
MSSNKAEFTAAIEAGKYILCVQQSILDQLEIPQEEATILYKDVQDALLLVNVQQPTKQTRHVEIKSYPIQEMVECD